MTQGTVIVPAHNEGSVIERTLRPLAPLLAAGVEIIVAANGCFDDTAARARTLEGVTVLEIPIPSKSRALNAADAVATRFPRLYLDADISITAATALRVLDRLSSTDILAARPAFRYDTSGADRWVRAYFRARARIPVMSRHLWGAGCYGLNEAGHHRLREFPEVLADDLYVDELFQRSEIDIISTAEPVRVRCPKSWRVLLSTLRRVQGGRSELAERQAIVRIGGVRPLLKGVRGPAGLLDAGVYAGLSLAARVLPRSSQDVWQRDETTRTSDSDPLREAAKQTRDKADAE